MEQARPVPAPRRLYPELRPANYENIEIRRPNSPSNNINHNNIKKLNINAENLHGNCAEKKLPSSGQNKLILQENNSDSQQPIYGPDANENVQEPVYATPRPAPRQRLPPAGEPEDSYPDPDDEVPLRILRAAPQIPPKPLNILLDQRSSICSEVSTTSVQTPGKADEDREGSRYASNASLDCSESSHSGKFKSQSPGYVDAVDSSIPQSDHPDPNGHHPQAESSSAEQSSGSQDGDDDK